MTTTDEDDDGQHMYWCQKRGTPWDWRCCNQAVGPLTPLRALLVRVVTAQQWATAISLFDYFGEGEDDGSWSAMWPNTLGPEALPCADDVVTDLLGF